MRCLRLYHTGNLSWGYFFNTKYILKQRSIIIILGFFKKDTQQPESFAKHCWSHLFHSPQPHKWLPHLAQRKARAFGMTKKLLYFQDSQYLSNSSLLSSSYSVPSTMASLLFPKHTSYSLVSWFLTCCSCIWNALSSKYFWAHFSLSSFLLKCISPDHLTNQC